MDIQGLLQKYDESGIQSSWQNSIPWLLWHLEEMKPLFDSASIEEKKQFITSLIQSL